MSEQPDTEESKDAIVKKSAKTKLKRKALEPNPDLTVKSESQSNGIKKKIRKNEKSSIPQETNGDSKIVNSDNPSGAETKQPSTSDTKDSSSSDANIHSPFHIRTVSKYLPLAPISERTPLEGICAEHISPLLLAYHHELDAVVLSYSNVRLSDAPDSEGGAAQLVNECAAWHMWVHAEFLLFQPRKGDIVEGHIKMHASGHLGLICYNLFNASIEKSQFPEEWSWRETFEEAEDPKTINNGMSRAAKRKVLAGAQGHGYWEDDHGRKVEGTLKFRVLDVDATSGLKKSFLTLEGTMLEEEKEINGTKSEKAANGAS